MITALIPLYGELNRIYKDWIDCHEFTFEKQKMIATFHSEYDDITAEVNLTARLFFEKKGYKVIKVQNTRQINWSLQIALCINP